MSQAEGFTSKLVCPCQTMQLAEQTQRKRVSIETCVRLLGDLGEPVALEAGHVCWCISKRSSEVNVTLLSVTSGRCCLCKVPKNSTFQQVHAISALSLSYVPAPMALAFSSSSNMKLCKSCVPGKDSHCYHYVACTTEDCLHSFCT